MMQPCLIYLHAVSLVGGYATALIAPACRCAPTVLAKSTCPPPSSVFRFAFAEGVVVVCGKAVMAMCAVARPVRHSPNQHTIHQTLAGTYTHTPPCRPSPTHTPAASSPQPPTPPLRCPAASMPAITATARPRRGSLTPPTSPERSCRCWSWRPCLPWTRGVYLCVVLRVRCIVCTVQLYCTGGCCQYLLKKTIGVHFTIGRPKLSIGRPIPTVF